MPPLRRSLPALQLPKVAALLFLPGLLFGFVFCLNEAKAIENGTNGTFNETAPTVSNIPHWNVGWNQPAGQSGVTGWNYVGIVAGNGGPASGIYLRNGWVLTAGHVGAANFTLGSGHYTVVPGTAYTGFTWTFNGNVVTADITIFQVQPDGSTTFSLPSLPALPIATAAPTASKMAMLGFGDGGPVTNETWGLNTVTGVNQAVAVDSFVSNDIETAYGAVTIGVNNDYKVVVGDSGGADFIFNTSTSQWELVGFNEAVDASNNDSFFVQLNTYASQINAKSAQPVPALPSWGWLVLPSLILTVVFHSLPRKSLSSRVG